MFCAAQAGQLGCRVLLLDNGKKPGRKILMSGGGRCNFTNMYVEPEMCIRDRFHEFGHGLHHMLTRIDTAGVSGISGVPWRCV